MIDSNCDEISLISIFDYFNGQICPYLVDKPKIFMIDACRGDMASKPVSPISNPTQYSGSKVSGVFSSGTAPILTDQVVASVGNDNNDNNNDNLDEFKHSPTISTVPINRDIKAYHKEANFRYIYGNPDGYSVPDGGKLGGYLIRATKHIFLTPQISLRKHLSEIILEIRKETQKLAGAVSMENVQDIDHLFYKVMFQYRDHVHTAPK